MYTNTFISFEDVSRDLAFDDVLLIPQYSDVESRNGINLASDLSLGSGIVLSAPIIAANMDSVCDQRMAITLANHGVMGVIHRYMSCDEQIKQVSNVYKSIELKSNKNKVAAAIGIKNGAVAHAQRLIEAGASVIVIDVAHGHHSQVAKTLESLRRLTRDIVLMAGNVSTTEGTKFLADAGAHVVKVGVGSGSICTTRIVTGHGVPQLSAIVEAADFVAEMQHDVKIIADGGIRTSGDIVKALAAGADFVMVGSLFAGTDEAPGEVFVDNNGEQKKIYRGMASLDAQKEFYGNFPDAPEGVTTVVPYKKSVINILNQLVGGIRSGLSYSGARNLKELREKAQWGVVTSSGLLESQAVPSFKK